MITQPVKDNCPCKRDQEGKCPCDPNIPIIEGAKANINNTIGLAGNALLGGSMTGEPNPAMGALGGALSGFSAGGPLGAIIGAIGGFGTAGTARSDYEKTLEDQKNRYIKDRTFLPDSAEEGGMPGTILQTELGEHLVLPSMEISKVNAKEKHKDMKKHEVTDIVPEGTIVFSAKKIFDPKKDADFELTPALSYYNDTDTFDYKAQTVGDILGTKKMTFAEAIEKVKKYYPTTDEKSLVAEETNKQNLEARKPIVDYLFLKQSGGKPKEIKGELPKASDGWPESRKHLEGVGLLEPQIMEKGGKAGDPDINTKRSFKQIDHAKKEHDRAEKKANKVSVSFYFINKRAYQAKVNFEKDPNNAEYKKEYQRTQKEYLKAKTEHDDLFAKETDTAIMYERAKNYHDIVSAQRELKDHGSTPENEERVKKALVVAKEYNRNMSKNKADNAKER
ncbi:MAG: glycine zipper family protein, partial [Luteimonas sp.]